MMHWGQSSDSRGHNSVQCQRGPGAHTKPRTRDSSPFSCSARPWCLLRCLLKAPWPTVCTGRRSWGTELGPGPHHCPLPRLAQDTLRDCTHDERSCLSSLQFVSPLYFVSFVLTAQFVLINVVVAVLMKHLDDSNKEAQEEAEMDAELELEMAHGLGPGPRPPAGSPGAPSREPGGAGSGGDAEGPLCRRCYSPAQVGSREGMREAGHHGAGGAAGPGGLVCVVLDPTLLSSGEGVTL